MKPCRDCGQPVIGRPAHAQLCIACGEASQARFKAFQDVEAMKARSTLAFPWGKPPKEALAQDQAEARGQADDFEAEAEAELDGALSLELDEGIRLASAKVARARLDAVAEKEKRLRAGVIKGA